MAEPRRQTPFPAPAPRTYLAHEGCTFSLDYEFPLGLSLGKSVIQGRKRRDVAVNRGDRIKACTQPPYEADPRGRKVRVPALQPLRSQAETHAARAAGEARSCRSSHRQHPWETLSEAGKRQTQISCLLRAAMLLSDTCSRWDEQANQEMQQGRTSLSQDLGHILASSIKNSLPHPTAAI